MAKRKTVTVVRYLAQHDGDDRTGRLSGTLLDLLELREGASGSREFQQQFDDYIATWGAQLEAEDG